MRPEFPFKLGDPRLDRTGGLGDTVLTFDAVLIVRIALDCAPALRVPIMRQLVGSTDLLGSAEPKRTAAIA